jgi:hypothetical protein
MYVVIPFTVLRQGIDESQFFEHESGDIYTSHIVCRPTMYCNVFGIDTSMETLEQIVA